MQHSINKTSLQDNIKSEVFLTNLNIKNRIYQSQQAMSLQMTALNSFTFQFFQQKFLQQFKKQAESRSKPSKAVLQALKHSTTLNKTYKTEIQSIRAELSSANQQNDFLKSLIDNLKNELQFLKQSKEEKFKKLCENQAKLLTKVEFLTNQNSLLKKQIEILKSKVQSSSHLSIEEKHDKFDNIMNVLLQNSTSNQLKKSDLSQSSLRLHESSKFQQYVNYESRKKDNYETQPSSNFKISLQESNNFEPTKKSSFGRSEEELTKMLNLRHDSKDYIDHEEHLVHQSEHFSSLEDLSSKITQITSEQQIFIEEDSKKIETPTLKKVISDKNNDPKFMVFSQDKNQPQPYKKGSEFTFLNLQTRKSIEQVNGEVSQMSMRCQESGKISLVDNILFEKDELKDKDEQIYLSNISGVDYAGLMEDIHNGQEQVEDTYSVEGQGTDDFFYKPSTHNSSEQYSESEKVTPKRTSSQMFCPEKIQKMNVEIKKITHQLQKEQNKKYSPFKPLTYQKPNQKVIIAVHQPVKYLTVAESYKTIEMSKSSKKIESSEGEQKKLINKNELQTLKNSSSLLSRSRCSPRSMLNSKLTIMKNVRQNMRHKTLSPVSIDEEVKVKNIQPTSPTTLHAENYLSNQQTSKSYSMIHSLRNKKMNVSTIKNNKSMNGDKNDENGENSLIQNFSSFRKNQDDHLRPNHQPLVTFKTQESNDDENISHQYDLINEEH